MNGAASWWDGVELWVASLPFIPQVALVVIVVLPIAVAIALALDRVLSEVTKLGPRAKAVRRETATTAEATVET